MQLKTQKLPDLTFLNAARGDRMLRIDTMAEVCRNIVLPGILQKVLFYMAGAMRMSDGCFGSLSLQHEMIGSVSDVDCVTVYSFASACSNCCADRRLLRRRLEIISV